MTQPLYRYVGSGATLESLRAHAARLAQLQGLVDQALPPYLAGMCHVANLKGDELILHAGSGAVAAKLRQSTPRLLNALAGHGVLLSAIKVATRPPPAVAPRREPTLRSVSTGTQDHLQALAQDLPEDAPLRQALERFMRHCRTRED
jgi:hypothetical protein